MFNTAALLLAIAATVSAVGTPSPMTPPPSDVQIESPPPSATGECSAVIRNLQQSCDGWWESRANGTNWGAFCSDPCFGMLRNATECLETDEDMKSAVPMLGLFDALCRRDGPGREYCGHIVTVINEENSCEDIENSTVCNTDVRERQCQWKDGRCHPRIDATLLDKACSTCLRGIQTAIVTADAANDRAFRKIAKVVDMLVTRECIKQGDEYCSVLMEDVEMKTNSDFASFCAVPKLVGCARKMLPLFVSDGKKEALRSATDCAARHIYQGVTEAAVFFDAVEEDCGACYANQVVEAMRTGFIANSVCDRNAAGAYCIPLVTGESDQSGGSDTVISCYRSMMNGTCDTLCNQLMSAAVTSFGCCAGLVQSWNHLEPTTDDQLAFDAAMQGVWQHRFNLQDYLGENYGSSSSSGGSSSGGSSNSNNMDNRERRLDVNASGEPMDNETDSGNYTSSWGSWGSWGNSGSWGSWGSWGNSGSWGSWGSWGNSGSWGSWGSWGSGSWGSGSWGSHSGSYGSGSGSGNGCGSGNEGGVDLSVLAVCSSLTNIETRAASMTCMLPRAATKVTKALKLKLNCTAVTESTAIMDAVELSLAADIAAALGLSVSALLNRIFRCPLSSARRVAASASFEFTIQTEDAATTTAAGAALDSALASNTLRFPALTTTVSTVCTSCASAADLESFAEATTPESDSTTSSSSIVTVMTAAVLLLVTAVFM